MTNFHTQAKEPNPQPRSLAGKETIISPFLVAENIVGVSGSTSLTNRSQKSGV
ncbi:hypothetical protein IQ227_01690 [Anabaena aphanizomenioides LEGE 00250]|uniref:Uncharacterized protein n=1 Tax=Sphaerospermopsis aphanizomenoides LEGE 00250 TaxID=2777972 RepID=A0ABR9VAN0_9CYAN|nr:hypothetical protein [Sphaerospermopsis aphanizomenoides LEGE 00250]